MINFQIITLREKNIKDFAKSRNDLLKNSTTDWVLFLDTDEILSPELKKEIEELDPGKFDGFYIKRKIIFLGQKSGEDKVLRLGKKSAGKWTRKVHETWNIKGRVGTLKNYIVHNTAMDMYSYIEKMNKYSDIHAVENISEGKSTSLLKIIIYPKLKLIKNILNGRSFVFSMLQSFHSFLGWAKIWELQRK